MKKNWKRLLAMLLVVTTFFVFSASAEGSEKKIEGLRIGYCINLTSHDWYQGILSGCEERAEELGIEFILADADNDAATQVAMCENLLTQDIDVMIVSPVDPNVLGSIVTQAHELGVKVLVESNDVEGADAYVSVDNELCGQKVAEWLGAYCGEHGIDPHILIIGNPSLADCVGRVNGFRKGLEEGGFEYTVVQEVDGKGLKETAVDRASDALTANPDINVIFGINDDSILGGVQAIKTMGLNEDDFICTGLGMEGVPGRQALMSGGAYRGVCGFFSKYAGSLLINVAVELANDATDRYWYINPGTIVDPQTWGDYYIDSGKGDDTFYANVEAVSELADFTFDF